MVKKISLGERLARFGAVDKFSIGGITKSDQRRELLREKGYFLTKTQTDVMNLIMIIRK